MLTIFYRDHTLQSFKFWCAVGMLSYEIDLLDLEGFIVGLTHLLYLIEHFPCDNSHAGPVDNERHSFLGLSKEDA